MDQRTTRARAPPDARGSFDWCQSDPYDVAVLHFDQSTGLSAADVADPGYLDDLGRQGIRGERFTAVGYGAVRASKKKGAQGIDSDSQARYSAEQSMQSIEPAWLSWP